MLAMTRKVLQWLQDNEAQLQDIDYADDTSTDAKRCHGSVDYADMLTDAKRCHGSVDYADMSTDARRQYGSVD